MLEILKLILSKISKKKKVYGKNYLWGIERSRTEFPIDLQTGASYDWFRVACTPTDRVLVG